MGEGIALGRIVGGSLRCSLRAGVVRLIAGRTSGEQRNESQGNDAESR